MKKILITIFVALFIATNFSMCVKAAAPTAMDDDVTANEDTILNGDVFADNGYGIDWDLESDPFTVTEVNGILADVGVEITLGSGALLTQNSDGTFSYDPNSQFESLDVSDTDIDSYTYTISDGSGADIATVTITIDGAEDAPVLGGVITGTVAEDGTLTDSGAITITDEDANDNPISWTDEAATIGDNGYGTFEITSGTWTYILNNAHAAVQALDIGETLTDTYTFTATDTSTQMVTITIDGAEDAPVLGGVITGTVAEDGSLTDSAGLTITDVDTSDNPISWNDEAATAGDNGYGTFEITGGTWTYILNNAHAAVQALDVGETLTDTYTFTASDSSTQLVTITIDGAEDAPVLGGVITGTVAEDGTLTDSYTITITDVDTSDNPISWGDEAATVGDNGYGTFEITGGTWTYILNNAHAAVQALDVGETLTDTYTFTATDASTQQVTITINGAEDAPVLGGVITGTVAEDGTLTDSDTITITDIDTSDNPTWNDETATAGDNGYGTFEITTGTWTYILNNAHAAVQALDVGETLTDTYTFTASDTSTQLVTITINGAEDAPVLGGVITGIVAEDGTLTDSGALTITDEDANDNPISWNDEAATAGDNGYGTFEITSGTWTYILNNAHAAVQALDVGETLTDTYTFTATDASTQQVTITIDGAEDAPVLGGVITGTVAEDGSLTDSAGLTITDVDTSDNPISWNNEAATAGDNGYGTFEITTGTWTYILNNAHAAVQALDVGETLTDTYTFTASDTSTQLVTITIDGAEDAPVLGGVITGIVAEDGTLTDSGALTITDEDANDNPISWNDEAATAGDNGYGTFEITSGTWTYILNNAHAAVQALDVGETLTDTYTFTASDTSTQLVTITIDGAEDAPVLSPIGDKVVNEEVLLTFTATATDVDLETLTFTLDIGSPAGAGITAGGVFTWTPTEAQGPGNYPVTIRVSDGVLEDFETINIEVTDINVAPVAGNDAATLNEDSTATTIDVLANDVDQDSTITINAITQGTNGTVTITNSGADLTYLPDADFFGTDTFTYNITDGEFNDTATVTITVTNVNDNPLAVDDVASVDEDSSTSISVLTNDDFTPDTGETLTVTAVTQGANGTVTIASGSTKVIYQPNVNYFGTDTFTYTISDGNGGTATATVTMTINNVNDAPTITTTGTTSATDGDIYTIDFDASDIDGDTIAWSVTGADWLSIDSTGILNGSAQTGIYTIRVTASDGNGGSDTHTYKLTVEELDSDNDGVPDESDAFPTDANETVDTDGDKIGNNADTDDDGDGEPDITDDFPLDSSETTDTDGDKIGNNADTDDDGDGVLDGDDPEPENASVTGNEYNPGWPYWYVLAVIGIAALIGMICLGVIWLLKKYV